MMSCLRIQDVVSHQAPLVEEESVQRMKVEIQGESFKMTEERKVMFRSYRPLTFIQTDKPIYTPGQTGELWMFLWNGMHKLIVLPEGSITLIRYRADLCQQ